MREIENIKYYTEHPQIGLWRLWVQMKVSRQPSYQNIADIGMSNFVDIEFIFLVCERLKRSINQNDRWQIAIDLSSFYFFSRIYFDSLAACIHELLKIVYPSDSRKWLVRSSFNEMLKKLEGIDEEPLLELKSKFKYYKWDEAFSTIKEVRDSLKRNALKRPNDRMVWNDKSYFKYSDNLRDEVGYLLYKIIGLTDFLGDFFLCLIPLPELDPDGYDAKERGKLTAKHIKIFRWYIKNIKHPTANRT